MSVPRAEILGFLEALYAEVSPPFVVLVKGSRAMKLEEIVSELALNEVP